MTIKNAASFPKRYYGLHMAEGVAEYQEPDGEPYRVLILENALKNMDPTYEGLPVYVQHVEDVNLNTLQRDAAGYVVRSFYNAVDGKHWVEFLVVSDEGHTAITQGWKLSNAYKIKDRTVGGKWHGVDYVSEITNGEYEHLALVPNPRYAESTILTPEEFKAYNSEKGLQIERLANSDTKEKPSMLSFFKKTKVENTTDLETTSVVLPKSKKEVTIAQLVNEADEIQNMMGYAHDDHMVKVNDSEEMSVKDLRSCYNKMKESKEEKEDEGLKEGEGKKGEVKLDSDEQVEVMQDTSAGEDEKVEKKAEEIAEHEKKEIEEKKQNSDKEAEKAKEKENFDSLQNAHTKIEPTQRVVETSDDRVKRGQNKYGSKK